MFQYMGCSSRGVAQHWCHQSGVPLTYVEDDATERDPKARLLEVNEVVCSFLSSALRLWVVHELTYRYHGVSGTSWSSSAGGSNY